jgi:hypothetical protein
VGAGWGWAVGAAVVMSWGPGEVLAAIAIGLLYGGTMGALVGLLLGMPIVVVIDVVRPRVRAWRPLGTALAAVFAPLLSFLVVDDSIGSWSMLLVMGSFLIVVGATAWIGLGWIFAAPRDVIPGEAQGVHPG